MSTMVEAANLKAQQNSRGEGAGIAVRGVAYLTEDETCVKAQGQDSLINSL